MVIISEVDTRMLYGEEAVAYGTEAASIASLFGRVQSHNIMANRGYIYVYEIGGGRSPQQIVTGRLACNVDVTFLPQTGAWLKYVLGSVTGAGTAGDPYIYAVADALTSLSITGNFELGTTDQQLTVLGCLANRCTMNCEEGKPVEVTLNFLAQKFTKDNAISAYSPVSTGIYHYVHGSLQTPSGTTIAEVPKASLVITNNIENYYAIGSIIGTGKPKSRDSRGTLSCRVKDGSWWNRFMQASVTDVTTVTDGTPTALATLRLNLTDGTRYLYLTFTTVQVDAVNTPSNIGAAAVNDVNIIGLTPSGTEVV